MTTIINEVQDEQKGIRSISQTGGLSSLKASLR
jgi:hypothetical protein